jgi:tRNA pseudouridine synthase 9
MHQLRVHLAHLGHPVVNDPLYGREGPRHVAAPTPMLDTAAAAAAATPSAALADIVAAIESRHAAYDATFDHVESAGASAAASEATDVDPFCFECTVRRRDPQPAELFLCLHASRYTGADWDYTAPPPPWAQVGFEVAAVNVQLDIENDEN